MNANPNEKAWDGRSNFTNAFQEMVLVGEFHNPWRARAQKQRKREFDDAVQEQAQKLTIAGGCMG